MTHVRTVVCSLPPFSLSQVVNKTYYIESITCTLCKSAVCEPVQVMPCKSLMCCSCLLCHLDKELDTFECPGCSEKHDNNTSSFSKLSPVAEKILSNMMVKCEKCYKPIKLLISKKSCDHHGDLSCSNLMEVVSLPLDVQPTIIKKQVSTNVVTRLLHHNDNTIVMLEQVS